MKRCYSLKRNKTFRYVYRKGRSVRARSMVLVFARSRQQLVQAGFSVSKKLGNSVRRNRIKRQLREAFTPLIAELKGGYSLIFIVKEPILEESFWDMCSTMRYLVNKAGLTKAQGGAAAKPGKEGGGH